ncbi:AAEL001924-PA, partial [Aedes aegypti]
QATANHECSLCEQVFYKKTDLAKHREVHLKSPCQFCDRKKPFGSYKKLKEHFRMIHEKQIFKCEQCASSFLGRREHENHIEKHRDGTIDNCVEFALRLWNDDFKCTVCDRSFYNETYLDAHREKEHKVYNIKAPDCKSNMIVPDYKFKCKECDATYRLKSSLKGHVFKNHRSQPKVCTHCGATFKSNNELDCHVRYLHTKDFRFKCDFCDKRCNTNSDLQVHRRTHTNERPYKCSYEGCGKDYKTNGAIIKHIRSVHTMERPYKCSYENCDRSFVCSQQLKSHGFTHTKEKPFPCAYCELRFNQNYLRRAHCRKRHPGQPDEACLCVGIFEFPNPNRPNIRCSKLEYKYKCDDCSAKFRLKTSLKGHWRKNHSGEKFICEHCGACFKSRAEMMMHDRYLHAKITPFACDFCDKRCHTKNDLKIHRRSHTNEKPYKCWHEGCDKAYKTRSAVTKHFRIHTGEKPYKCSYEGCDKSYACSQLLKVHRRKHTLEKPFKCYYCELYFDSTNNRRKHCHRHHAGLPIGRELERLNQQGAKGNSTGESTEHSEGSRSAEMPVKQ